MIMRKLLPLLFATLCYSGHAQTADNSMKLILDTVILSAKETSYYAQTVNWDSLETKMYASAENAQEIDDLKPAFGLLINALRDHHGRVMSLADYSLLASFTDRENTRSTDQRAFDSETWAVVNNVDSRFEYAVLSGNIGYLKVVGIGPNVDGQTEAERIRNAVLELHNENIEKWIIDLRYNGGGNINVMLSGLAPLLDTGTVASIKDHNGAIQCTADVKKGNFWYCGQNVFEIKGSSKIKHPKIAVLTSRWTVSSGELVAVSFKGQEHTKFFGEATGGYTTNTGWSTVNNEVVLVIATGVYCDRNGQSYDQNVEPDTEILFEVEENRSEDKGIVEAVKWLEGDEK